MQNELCLVTLFNNFLYSNAIFPVQLMRILFHQFENTSSPLIYYAKHSCNSSSHPLQIYYCWPLFVQILKYPGLLLLHFFQELITLLLFVWHIDLCSGLHFQVLPFYFWSQQSRRKTDNFRLTVSSFWSLQQQQ